MSISLVYAILFEMKG